MALQALQWGPWLRSIADEEKSQTHRENVLRTLFVNFYSTLKIQTLSSPVQTDCRIMLGRQETRKGFRFHAQQISLFGDAEKWERGKRVQTALVVNYVDLFVNYIDFYSRTDLSMR